MFTLKFKTSNAAFREDDPQDDDQGDAMRAECARILKGVAFDLEQDLTEGSCRDVNGNVVGEWRLS